MMKAVRTKIGWRIRYFRSRRGLTQKELGLLLVFSQSTAEVLRNVERKRGAPFYSQANIARL